VKKEVAKCGQIQGTGKDVAKSAGLFDMVSENPTSEAKESSNPLVRRVNNG
jgi:hypothetical protein